MSKNAKGKSSQLNTPSITTNLSTSDGEDDNLAQNVTFTAPNSANEDEGPIVNKYKMKLLVELIF